MTLIEKLTRLYLSGKISPNDKDTLIRLLAGKPLPVVDIQLNSDETWGKYAN